ncbi:MAG TPA: hypothetical protein VNQ34_10085 [Xanthobacteraceae bacterium]|jgi:hypothetical protein|nr:hypothetical protein [Xanthobacteraceae bacterium]
MNAERLNAIAAFLLESEKTNNIQKQFENLNNHLGQLVSQPSNSDFQSRVAAAIKSLDKTLNAFYVPLTGSYKDAITDILGLRFYSPSVIAEIEDSIKRNVMTPAVVQQDLSKLLTDRNEFLASLKALRTNLKKVGVETEELSVGETELSVLIPRALFKNDLEGLSSELKNITFIIRSFSEAANISPEPIEVREISTTDPTFFLGVDVSTLVLLSLAVKWCLDSILAGLKIRELAATAKTTGIDESIVEQITKSLEAKTNRQIEDKVKEIMKDYAGDEGTKHEVEQKMQRSITFLYARIERGMIMQPRGLPPPKTDNETEEKARQRKEIEELNAIASTLEFPAIPGEPTVKLTSAPPAASDGKTRSDGG